MTRGAAAAALRAALGRAIWSAAVLAGAIALLQGLLWAAPGDAIDLLPNGEELRPALEAEWGLEGGLIRQIGRALRGAATGDLGASLTVRPGQPVAALVAAAAARSAMLLIPALVLAIAAGVVLAAWGRPLRRPVQAVSLAPVFLLAWLLVTGINEATFALIQRGTIAPPGWFALPLADSPLRSALGVGVLAVGSGTLTELQAEIHEEIRRVRASPFVEAARARGARLGPHVLPNLLGPVAALAASRVAFLLGGLVVLEKVLLIPGAGSLLWEACLKRDYPLALGLALAAAVVVCAARLAGDATRIAIDPRLWGR